ncbi:hypothetical protein JTB14_029301 [Gonioctena quinquepunctata]|nr:hypothetical protein JTB14_029301 [Gonioctena quinquepunctata]
MSHLININSDEKEIPTGGSNSSQPKYGVDKKNRNTQIGEAKLSEEDEKNGFAGRDPPEKKVWLFVSRVKDHVTEEIIRKYLSRKKTGGGQFHIKEINPFKK